MQDPCQADRQRGERKNHRHRGYAYRQGDLIDGLDTAAAMLKEAIGKGQTIYIAGDYDVDGIFATAILALALKALNANMVLRLPKRFTEGYGLKRDLGMGSS